MDCPKCAGESLERLELQGIEVDRCPRCSGVWLDEYELEDLLELDASELQALLTDAPPAARTRTAPTAPAMASRCGACASGAW